MNRGKAKVVKDNKRSWNMTEPWSLVIWTQTPFVWSRLRFCKVDGKPVLHLVHTFPRSANTSMLVVAKSTFIGYLSWPFLANSIFFLDYKTRHLVLLRLDPLVIRWKRYQSRCCGSMDQTISDSRHLSLRRIVTVWVNYDEMIRNGTIPIEDRRSWWVHCIFCNWLSHGSVCRLEFIARLICNRLPYGSVYRTYLNYN